jgi:hypothetical protein
MTNRMILYTRSTFLSRMSFDFSTSDFSTFGGFFGFYKTKILNFLGSRFLNIVAWESNVLF